MANARNKKFTFGFYNSAQDEDHVQPLEATDAYNIDADKLGLGTLEYRNYVTGSETPVDKVNTSLSSRAFRLNSGQPEFEKQSGMADWEGLNDNTYPPSPSAPNIVAVTAVNGVVSEGDIVGVTFSVPTAYSGPTQRTYNVEIQADPGATEDVTIRWKFSSDASWRRQNVEVTFGVAEPLTEGVEVTIPSGTYTPGDACSYSVSEINLPDGSYVYAMVNVASASHDPAVDIESVPSEGTLFVLDNINDVNGSIQANLAAQITFDPDPLPANVDDQWLYRKDPDTNDYVLVKKRSDLVSPFEFTDLTEIAQLQSIDLLEGEDDLSFSEIYTAIGATTMDRIFEKDNRIWLVPTERPDLVLYSEANDFWRFRLVNSFSFGGDIREIKFIKDSSVVGGEFTTVFFTSNGIYHIVGDGTENTPYRRITAVADVAVQPNSVVDLNGIIALSSQDTGYDDGQYGRKLYEYDLSKLIEISARAKNDSFFDDTYAISWSKMIGGDKYLAYDSTKQRGLLYHRDAQGVMPFDQAQSGWYWKSKRVNVEYLFRAPAGYARFMKFELKGNVTFTLTLFADDLSETDQFVYNMSKVNRGEIIQRMPRLSGRKWQIEFSGGSSDILYNFYFVQ